MNRPFANSHDNGGQKNGQQLRTTAILSAIKKIQVVCGRSAADFVCDGRVSLANGRLMSFMQIKFSCFLWQNFTTKVLTRPGRSFKF
jgi:hypothetical protein